MKAIETIRRQIWPLWLLMFLWAAPLASQTNTGGEEVGLRMDVDKRQVEVGDSLSLTIEFKQLVVGGSNISAEPNFPTPEHFDARGTFTSSQVTIVNQKTAQTTTTHLNLVATKPGSETLGPASVIFQDPSGKKREITSNVINVTVIEKKPFSLFGGAKPTPQGNPNSSAQTPVDDNLRGLKPLLPESFVPIFKSLLLALIVVLILAFITWKFWGGSKKPARKVPTIGEEGRLREAWRKLADDELSSEAFCRALSTLVRECLQYQCGFEAVDFTTEEIFKELKKKELTTKQMEAVEKCLKACDRVLYADGNLTGRDTLKTLAANLLPKVQ
jgi:hypothetical protein